MQVSNYFFEINSTYCSRCSSILFSACCKTFYGELVEFMSRGAIVAAILEKDNAVEDFRTDWCY
jgi:nucleoside diphosphate kinase